MRSRGAFIPAVVTVGARAAPAVLQLACSLAYACEASAAQEREPKQSAVPDEARGDASPDLVPSPTSLQWHVALTPGLCALNGSTTGLRFCTGLGGHVLFGRSRDSDLGWGPYARILAVWSEGVSVAGGGSVLLPVNPTFPFILSLGGLVRPSGGGFDPGIEASLFFGPSSYNFHSSYSMASGLLIGVQQVWGSHSATSFALALQVDMAWLALPVIAFVEVLRGPPAR